MVMLDEMPVRRIGTLVRLQDGRGVHPAVKTAHLVGGLAQVFGHELVEAREGFGLLPALELRHVSLLDVDPHRLLEGTGHADVPSPDDADLVDDPDALGITGSNGREDSLGERAVQAHGPVVGVVLGSQRLLDDAFDVGAVGMLHDPLGARRHQRGGLEADLGHELVRRQTPVAGEQRCRGGHVAGQGNVALLQDLRDLPQLFLIGEVDAIADEHVRAKDRIAHHPGHPPGLARVNSVTPEHGGPHRRIRPKDIGIGAALLYGRLHPRHRILVHEIDAAVTSVMYSQNQHLHARLDIGAVVHEIAHRNGGLLGNHRTHEKILLAKVRIYRPRREPGYIGCIHPPEKPCQCGLPRAASPC